MAWNFSCAVGSSGFLSCTVRYSKSAVTYRMVLDCLFLVCLLDFYLCCLDVHLQQVIIRRIHHHYCQQKAQTPKLTDRCLLRVRVRDCCSQPGRLSNFCWTGRCRNEEIGHASPTWWWMLIGLRSGPLIPHVTLITTSTPETRPFTRHVQESPSEFPVLIILVRRRFSPSKVFHSPSFTSCSASFAVSFATTTFLPYPDTRTTSS